MTAVQVTHGRRSKGPAGTLAKESVQRPPQRAPPQAQADKFRSFMSITRGYHSRLPRESPKLQFKAYYLELFHNPVSFSCLFQPLSQLRKISCCMNGIMAGSRFSLNSFRRL